jgi:hypothetical protein
VVVTREPEFEQFDREHFEAYLDIQADKCPGCGGHLPETKEAYAYDVEHETCRRCWALAKNQRDLEKKAEKDKDIIPAAERWSAIPVIQPGT